jgi:hypothetical protein
LLKEIYMAFDSTTSITFAVPTISAYFASVPTTSVNVTLKKVEIDAVMLGASIYTLNRTLRKPLLSASVSSPIGFSLNRTIPIPTIISAFNSVGGITVNAVMRMPIAVIRASLASDTVKQTWAINTITSAHSRYTNYGFNSYCKIGDKFYGLKEDGIYELAGEFDTVTDIIDNAPVVTNTHIDAEIALPLSDFDEQQLKMCSDAFAYCRTDGELEVVVVTDEQYMVEGLSIYDDGRAGMHRKRVKIPKGLKGNSWQFIVKNVEGSDFGINAFEIMVKTLQRVMW